MKFSEIEAAIDRMRSEMFNELCKQSKDTAGFDGRNLIQIFDEKARLAAIRIREENVFNVPVVLKTQRTEGRMAFSLDPTQMHLWTTACGVVDRVVNSARGKFVTEDDNAVGVQDVEFWETTPDYGGEGVDQVDQFVISVVAYTNTAVGKDQYDRCIKFIRDSLTAESAFHFYATRPWPGYHEGHQE